MIDETWERDRFDGAAFASMIEAMIHRVDFTAITPAKAKATFSGLMASDGLGVAGVSEEICDALAAAAESEHAMHCTCCARRLAAA